MFESEFNFDAFATFMGYFADKLLLMVDTLAKWFKALPDRVK